MHDRKYFQNLELSLSQELGAKLWMSDDLTALTISITSHFNACHSLIRHNCLNRQYDVYAFYQNRNISICTVLCYELDVRGTGIRVLAGARNCSLLRSFETGSGAHRTFWGVKRPEHGADQWPPSDAEVKYPVRGAALSPPIHLSSVMLY